MPEQWQGQGRFLRSRGSSQLSFKNVDASDINPIGIAAMWGGEGPLAIRREDRRHHLYVLGKTGSGKTTLLRNLILQDINDGQGVGVIDPHGDLVDEILNHIPRRRTDDVVYFDPSDGEFPIGFNVFFNVPRDRRHLVASGLVSAFKSIWRESWGPRMEYILYAATAALLDCPNTSLLGLQRMLSDARYRAWVVKQIQDPLVRVFWTQEFAAYDQKFVREAIAPIQNKIGQFLMCPPIRNIVGQVRSTIEPRFMMDDGRIFIANLSKGKLGEEKANLLGSILVTQFQLAALSRMDLPERKRRDFFLFIDEFHNFTTDSFSGILAEARKYRLCLTLSHQYTGQLTDDVRQGVFGNVGTIIAFALGYADAEILEQEFSNAFHAAEFIDLNKFEILLKMRAENRTLFLRGKTLPPTDGWVGRRENLIRRSREKYATPRAVVEDKISRWMRN